MLSRCTYRKTEKQNRSENVNIARLQLVRSGQKPRSRQPFKNIAFPSFMSAKGKKADIKRTGQNMPIYANFCAVSSCAAGQPLRRS